ncbi:hypothetical protein FBU30_001861, partial [Linnemannia zychae]
MYLNLHYDPLEDPTFDETIEEEEEEEEEKEDHDDTEQNNFDEVENFNSKDRRQLIENIRKNHDGCDSLAQHIPAKDCDILDDDEDVTKSPTAAALTRIKIRNGKRPLRRTDDLRVAFNIQTPSMSTSD